MKFLRTAIRATSGLAVLVAVALSFVDAFVRISFETEFELDLDSSLGLNAWNGFARLGCVVAILSLIAIISALVVGLVGSIFVARILDVVAAGLVLVAIGLLLAWVSSNSPEFDETLDLDYGLGWSGYVVVGLLAAGGALSALSALLPGTAGETPMASAPLVAEPGAATPSQENQKALWSMILGIVSFACAAPITSIIAIVLANQAKREIAASGGQQTGESKASAGLILGIVSSVLSLLGIVMIVVLLLVGANSE